MIDQRRKWWPWALGLLLLLNVGTLIFFWMNHFHERRLGSAPPPKEMMADELDFNEKQKAEFFSLVKDHQEGSARIRREISRAKLEYYQFGGENGYNTLKLEKLKNAYGKLDSLNHAHFMQIRAICNEEQINAFDQLVRKILANSNFGFKGPENGRSN